MTFTSAGFALFFPCVVLVYYLVPARWQNLVLLGSSCLFYGFNLGGQPLSALVLALHVLFTYGMARAIERAEGTRRRRLTAAAILSVLAVLAVFKYYNALLPTLLGDGRRFLCQARTAAGHQLLHLCNYQLSGGCQPGRYAG